MTKKRLQEFKKLLTLERQKIVNQIRDQREEERSLQREDDDGFDDHGNDTAAELLEKLTDSEAKLIKKIDFALVRIEDESYGICVACEGEIPLNRLEAKPSVSLCRDCQTEHESKT